MSSDVADRSDRRGSRHHRLGQPTEPMITEYFAAPSDALAATVLHAVTGPGTPARGSGEPLFDAVSLPAVDPFVALGLLAEAAFAVPYGEVTADPRHALVVAGQDAGPFVVTVGTDLTARLAAASPRVLSSAARRWTASSATSDLDGDLLARGLCDLGELAWRAGDVRHRLYCWTRWPQR